jgi:hypothetical protein
MIIGHVNRHKVQASRCRGAHLHGLMPRHATPPPSRQPQAPGPDVKAGAAQLAHCGEEGRMLSLSGLEPGEVPLLALGVEGPERQALPPSVMASTCPRGLHMH